MFKTVDSVQAASTESINRLSTVWYCTEYCVVGYQLVQHTASVSMISVRHRPFQPPAPSVLRRLRLQMTPVCPGESLSRSHYVRVFVACAVGVPWVKLRKIIREVALTDYKKSNRMLF